MATANTETGQASLSERPKAKRSIKNLLIDRRFQLKYTILVALLAMAIAAVLGGLLYKEVKDNSQVTLTSLDAKVVGDDVYKATQTRLATKDSQTLLIIVACLGGLVLAILGIGIWLTHKVAGPIFIISRHLRQIGEGKLADLRPLRKGDELKDFYDVFQDAVRGITDREQADLTAVQETIATLTRSPDGAAVEAALAQLRAVEQRKRAAFGG